MRNILRPRISPWKFIIILFFLMISLFTCRSEAQWIRLSYGISNLPISALASNTNTIFAGTKYPYPYGVYLSTNNGDVWIQTSLNNRNVSSISVNGNYIFAGTTTGIYFSANNGISWTQTSLNNVSITSLAINGVYIFAGSESGVYLSTNNGTSWFQTFINNLRVYSLAVNGSNVFAGNDSLGLYKSTNNGTNWIRTSLTEDVRSLAIGGNNIFAGTGYYYSGTGVYLSTNNGNNWIQTSLNNRSVYSLVISGNNIFAGSYQNYLYVSNDNGTNWTLRNKGLNSYNVRALCISNNYIFAGTDSGIYRRQLTELVGVNTISNHIPHDFSLSQNYPNPFNPVTKIKFDITSNVKSKTANVKLIVFDITGREVVTLVNEQLKPGVYEVDFDGSNYPSGVYYYRLITDNYSETKKMIILK